MLPLSDYLNMFFTLLAIVDPIGAIPIFLSMTPLQSAAYRMRIARITALAVGLALIAAALLGGKVLQLLGISLDSFRVAGGILLLLMAIPMLRIEETFFARRSRPVAISRGQKNDASAVVPLAIPLLAGPGAISSMTLYAQRLQSLEHLLVLIGVSLLVALVTGGLLFLAHPVGKLLGKTGIDITIRLMGLIIAAAAVQFIARGLLQMFPGLAGI